MPARSRATLLVVGLLAGCARALTASTPPAAVPDAASSPRRLRTASSSTDSLFPASTDASSAWSDGGKGFRHEWQRGGTYPVAEIKAPDLVTSLDSATRNIGESIKHRSWIEWLRDFSTLSSNMASSVVSLGFLMCCCLCCCVPMFAGLLGKRGGLHGPSGLLGSLPSISGQAERASNLYDKVSNVLDRFGGAHTPRLLQRTGWWRRHGHGHGHPCVRAYVFILCACVYALACDPPHTCGSTRATPLPAGADRSADAKAAADARAKEVHTRSQKMYDVTINSLRMPLRDLHPGLSFARSRG